MLTKTCEVCNKEFETNADDQKRCSRDCYFKTRRKRYDKVCIECGKSFSARADKQKYCSRACFKANYKMMCPICTCVFETKVKKQVYCSAKCLGVARTKYADPDGRTCIKCGLWKTTDKFSTICAGKYRNSYCKICIATKARRDSRTPEGRFSFSKCHARKKEFEWSIPKEHYLKLLQQKCHYCEWPLNECGVGLDRLDNDRGYTLDNVVPCCSSCNRTRSENYSYKEMLILAETIKNIKQARTIQGVL